jgi:TatD DNase family protein
LLVDTHAHLNDQRLAPQLPALLQAAQLAGVTKVIDVGFDLASSELAVAQATAHEALFAAVGLHPHDARLWSQDMMDALISLSRHHRVVAWGEIGLDYHYDLSPRETQQAVLRTQLDIAKSRDLPVIIHDRSAQADLLAILRAQSPYPAGGVMHCYSGSAEMVADYLELGFYVSFAGPLTFRNARRSVEAAAVVPLDRLLVETDAPYLSPEPYRGRENQPAQVVWVLRRLAEIRALEDERLAEIVSENADRLFGLSRVGR